MFSSDNDSSVLLHYSEYVMEGKCPETGKMSLNKSNSFSSLLQETLESRNIQGVPGKVSHF